jgi:hypothetical protein
MRTYDDEYKTLVAWAKERYADIKKIPLGEGFDGEQDIALHLYTDEWNRKLIALKQKHNKIA